MPAKEKHKAFSTSASRHCSQGSGRQNTTALGIIADAHKPSPHWLEWSIGDMEFYNTEKPQPLPPDLFAVACGRLGWPRALQGLG